MTVVGDTEHDIDCARANGFRAVAVETGWVTREALARESPDALLPALDAPDVLENYRVAAVYVDRILKGAKPAELPITEPPRLEMVLNLSAPLLSVLGEEACPESSRVALELVGSQFAKDFDIVVRPGAPRGFLADGSTLDEVWRKALAFLTERLGEEH